MELHNVFLLLLLIGTITNASACYTFSTGERGCDQITNVTSEFYVCYDCCDIQFWELPDGILTTNFISQSCFKISSVRVVRVVNNLTTIEEHAFAKATKMQVLYLNNLHLTNINITAYTIERIDLNNNSLTYVNLTRIQKLAHLNLGHNNLRTLDDCHFDEDNNISILDVSYNSLTGINSVLRFSNLTELYLSHNQIVYIPFEGLKQLSRIKVLELGENLISKISSDAFSLLPSLTNLNISYNRLTELDDNLFKSLINLHVLVLSGNKITYIKYVPLVSSMPSLHLLAFDNNPIFCHNAQEMLKYLQHHHVGLLRPGACSLQAGGICCFPGGPKRNDISKIRSDVLYTTTKVPSVTVTKTLASGINQPVTTPQYRPLQVLENAESLAGNIIILIVICSFILVVEVLNFGLRIFSCLIKDRITFEEDHLELIQTEVMDP